MTAWRQVLDDLVRVRGRALVRYATLLTGDEREGEDLVQDALVRCFSQGRPLREPAAAEAYVRRAVLTIFLDGHRRTARWTAMRHLLARDDDAADHVPASTAASRSRTARSSSTSSTRSGSSSPCWGRCPTRTPSTSSWSRQE